jgi:hypothetical protein
VLAVEVRDAGRDHRLVAHGFTGVAPGDVATSDAAAVLR